MEVYIEHILYFLLFSGFLHIGISKSSIYIILIPENENRYYQKTEKLTIANYKPDTILSDPQTSFI